MAAQEPVDVVIIDASVLINFIHIARLDLLGKLAAFRILVPEQVVAEITRPEQSQAMEDAFSAGWLMTTALTEHAEILDYAELHKTLGRGEASCIAAASQRGCLVACDERGGAFKRAVETRFESDVILATPDLIVAAIRSGLATVTEADAWKEVLAVNRFHMKFSSFAELL